jgi:hypothetical protein
MTFDPSQIPHVYHARSTHRSQRRLPTGCEALDDALCGGWPAPALVEILIDVYGIGELQLLLPLLQQLKVRGPQPPLIVWLNAPYLPNSVAFAQHALHSHHWIAAGLSERDALWAADQSLRSNACSVVLAWIPRSTAASLRRLKLAAMSAGSIGILFRCIDDAKHPSPANLRLLVRPVATALSIEVIKNEGRQPAQVLIQVPDAFTQGTRR